MNTRPCGSAGGATGATTGAAAFVGAGFAGAGGSPQAAIIKATRIDRYARMVAATLPQPTGPASTLDSRPGPAIPLGMRLSLHPRVPVLARAALLFLAIAAVACAKDPGGTSTTGSSGESSGDTPTTGTTGTTGTTNPTTTGITTIETIGDVSTTATSTSTGTTDTGTSTTTADTTGTTTTADTTSTSTSTTGGGGLGEGEICQDQPDACAPGLLCCYPCGVPDCLNKCIKPDPQTMMCPLFP